MSTDHIKVVCKWIITTCVLQIPSWAIWQEISLSVRLIGSPASIQTQFMGGVLYKTCQRKPQALLNVPSCMWRRKWRAGVGQSCKIQSIEQSVSFYERPFIFLRTDFPGRFWKTSGRKIRGLNHSTGTIYSAHFEVICLISLQHWCVCDLHFVFLLFLSSLLCHLFHGPLWHGNWKHHCSSPWYSISSHSSCLQSQTSGPCTFSWHWGCQNNGINIELLGDRHKLKKKQTMHKQTAACMCELDPLPLLVQCFLGSLRGVFARLFSFQEIQFVCHS